MAVRAANNEGSSSQLLTAFIKPEDFLHESGDEEILMTSKCYTGTPESWLFYGPQTTTEMTEDA